MPSLTDFRVVLFTPTMVFYSGQAIQGHVEVTLNRPKDMACLKIELKGEGRVHWTTSRTVSESDGEGGTRSRTVEDHHSASEKYLSMEAMLYPGPRLEAGQHMLPFTFILPPEGLPSSFEGQYGHVRYYVQAVIERSWKWNHRAKVHFSLCSVVDLNMMPACRNPGHSRDHKTFCCLCCRSGPLAAVISTPRTGYVPGEAILFSAEVDNQSNKEMNGSSVHLIELVSYRAADGQTRQERRVVAEQGRGPVRHGETDYWEAVALSVPPVPPSGLGGHFCHIMDVEYLLEFRVDPSGVGMDLVVRLGLTIGTIPLRDYMPRLPDPGQYYPPPAPGDGSAYLPASAPPLPDSFNPYADLPPPSYGESVWGQVDVRGQDDDGYTAGDFNFVPRYPTYFYQNQ